MFGIPVKSKQSLVTECEQYEVTCTEIQALNSPIRFSYDYVPRINGSELIATEKNSLW